MTAAMLVCTDLDRTLVPNGPQPESVPARGVFAEYCSRPHVRLAYVSGRDRHLVARAIANYRLPQPGFVVADVGTTIYQADGDDWRVWPHWQAEIAPDWNGHGRDDLQRLLHGLSPLRTQEPAKQNTFKLSFYVPLHADRGRLSEQIRERLDPRGIDADLIWSTDEPAAIGLLDIVPASATKLHAIEFLLRTLELPAEQAVFAGDSGNDLAVLTSAIPAVLVANAADDVRRQAVAEARAQGHADRLYCAAGNWLGLNGNYCAGILEGLAHYHPELEDWMSHRLTDTHAR